jgi:uncharacterized membrane protein
MNAAVVLIAVFGVGFLSGLRTFTPIALLSWMALWGWTPVAGSPVWFVGTQAFAIAISLLAVLELVGDKLPKTPARTHLMPLIGRFVVGGMAGAALSFTAGRSWLFGSLLGAIASVAGAFSGYHLRKAVVDRSRIPDLIVALLEDLVTVAGTLLLVHNFFHTPV